MPARSQSSDPNEDLRKLLEAAEKEGRREHLMILVSYSGALRVSELIHVRVRDFDFEAGEVRTIPLRKRSRNRASSKLDSEAVLMVRAYIGDQGLSRDSYLFPGRTRKSCHIVAFPDCSGGHISKREVQLIFDRIAGAAGVKKLGRGIQALKHAKLLQVARDTKDPKAVKETGKYSSYSMSVKYISEAEGG